MTPRLHKDTRKVRTLLSRRLYVYTIQAGTGMRMHTEDYLNSFQQLFECENPGNVAGILATPRVMRCLQGVAKNPFIGQKCRSHLVDNLTK